MELISRVSLGCRFWGDPIKTYDQMGAETREAIIRLLPDDWSFSGRRVLDFGCGAGRTLRHFLPEAEEGEFWGADIHGPSIDWIGTNLSPPLRAWQCAPAPPLGLEAGSFDLIWSISVFTHLPPMTSIPWLLELHRMLKPGGLMIGTYYGRWNSEYLAGEPWDENRIGMNVLRHNLPWELGGPVVFASDWWIRAHWGRAFEILDHLPRLHNFTWLLMRRRDVELTPEDIERPEDDPREYSAVRHNLRQVQREVELLSAQLRDLRGQKEREDEILLKLESIDDRLARLAATSGTN
jgi:SAM-dependent methyltransferase